MKQIFYVDDDLDMLQAVQSVLENSGFAVTTASDGPEALKMLQMKTPDLIIVDLRMEPMNGFELFEHIKKIPALIKTPVFILTALNDSLTQKYSNTLGVDAFINKPFDVDELTELIKNKLAQNEKGKQSP